MKNYWMIMICCCSFLGVAGCAEDKTGDGDAGYNSLIKMTEVTEATSSCEFGGLQIDTGLDLNRNSILEEFEIEQTQVLCTADPSGDPGQDGQDGAPTLFSSAPEEPGDNCRYGGISLHWGVDLNLDGELTVQEVTNTDYVCNGEPGKTPLVEVHTEDLGINCPAGGISVSAGFDSNGDDMLQPGEVTSMAYVCNAVAGQTSLIRLIEEPAGANCVRGGTKVQSGIDSNGSGVLDDPEVQYTQYVCNP
ncbi:hypothetical protein KKD52_00145 [Myxococcota bacterium]|jgi:hypothetical protein|nr:hypothetical protein [Myxococcota bacterium]MBU1411871.1 hypothetical protein [Myxococcota bacterium]MBU1508740.1 hypothetical protein [Myxococcota bacterium]PKN25647.1 MAG: hypothetical protein CVU65_08170 [Deltaproteobacteria bacterium HGW-Deltaproteobacteria-22]